MIHTNSAMICDHGRLWRACELCEYEARIAELEAENEKLRVELDARERHVSDKVSRSIHNAVIARAEAAEAELAAAREENERLRIERDARTELKCDGDCDRCGHTSQCYAENELRIVRSELNALRAHADDAGRVERVKVWDAINRYCVTCGGRPDLNIYGNTARQQAVVEVESVLAAAEGREP